MARVRKHLYGCGIRAQLKVCPPEVPPPSRPEVFSAARTGEESDYGRAAGRLPGGPAQTIRQEFRAPFDLSVTIRDTHARLSYFVAESLLQQRERTQYLMSEFRGQVARKVEMEPLSLAAETETPASPTQAQRDAPAQGKWHRVDRKVVVGRAVRPEDLQ